MTKKVKIKNEKVKIMDSRLRGNDNYNRSGSALLVVLGVVMAITIMALSFLSRSDTEMACGENMLLRLKTDYLADSALEHAKGLILNPQEISGQYWTGSNTQQIEAGDFYYDVSVVPNQSLSGNTQWCNYNINCEAYRLTDGQKTAQSNLAAILRLDPAIAYWSDLAADCQISDAVTINGDAYFADDLTSFGTINGDVFCNTLSGIKTGQQKACGSLSLQWPRVDANDFIAQYTVEPVASSSLSSQILGPYEPPRVFSRVGDLTIAGNVEINGMLIVEGNLNISGTNNSIHTQKNMPALLVTGDVKITENSTIDIQGLAVIDGEIKTSVGCEDVNVLGGLFVKGGLFETTRDSSLNGEDGLVFNNPAWLPAGGQINGALQCDGFNDYIEVDNESLYDISGRITVTAWMKVNAFDKNYQALVTKGDSSWRIQRYYNTNRIEFVCSGLSPNNNIISNKENVNDGFWHHIAGVYDGTRIYIYIDGLLDNSAPTSGAIVTNIYKVMIGENAQQRGRYWNGWIDDVRIYNEALDANDIRDVKDGIEGISNLVAHWKLDEDGNNNIVVTAAPARTAVYLWSAAGEKQKWSQAPTAFYKDIRRN